MEEIIGERISRRPGTTLKLKATLVPIEQYAVREGVSVKCIEKCAQLGMFYLRKYKGKVFVVDIPPDAYLNDSAITEDNDYTSDADDMPAADNEVPAETSDKPVTPAAFPQLVKKLLNRSCELAEKHYGPFEPPLKSPQSDALPNEFDEFIDEGELDRIIYETLNIKPSSDVDEIIEVPYEKTAEKDLSDLCETDEIKLVEEEDADEKFELDDEFPETGKESPFDPMKDFAQFQAEPFVPRHESRRSWRFAAAFLAILFLAAILGMFWFSLINPAIVQKTGSLPQTFESRDEPVQQPANNSSSGSFVPQSPDNGILLENSITQVENLRSDFSRFRQDYQTLSERNALAVERLDGEIKRLAAQSPTAR